MAGVAIAMVEDRRRGKPATDIRAKRPHETWLQWRSRVAHLDQTERDRNEPLVPVEAHQHARFRQESIVEVDGFTRAETLRREVESSLAIMRDKGTLSTEQWCSAIEIASISELYARAVSPGSTSYEPRVDTSAGGDRDELLTERMNAVRSQMAYTRWRDQLPMPRQMVIDMIKVDKRLFQIARRYGKGWPQARKWLLAALDRWPDIKDRVWREIGEQEVRAVYWRLGEGELR